jgi:hypothetical protein
MTVAVSENRDTAKPIDVINSGGWAASPLPGGERVRVRGLRTVGSWTSLPSQPSFALIPTQEAISSIVSAYPPSP